MKKIQKNGGYAILFTITLISTISLITVGILNATYKQILLSSLAKDSQTAFYQSDTATECALYGELVEKLDPLGGSSSFVCGINNLGEFQNLTATSNAFGGYNLESAISVSEDTTPCFNISVEKTVNPYSISTSINAKGYSVCDTTNPRAVERAILIEF